ncbi:Mov34-domain-containing protein [Ramicandelaber brevisporus]|nr:Mov34-domain-containing protein [Ramicandelaber brevisporus]
MSTTSGSILTLALPAEANEAISATASKSGASAAASGVAAAAGSSGAVSCTVAPAVLFSIVDHYLRRNSGQERVLGTLLGTVTPLAGSNTGAKHVEIRSCYAVPHSEDASADQILLDMEHHRMMYDLHKKANRREVIVGWYATSGKGDSPLFKYAPVIQQYFTSECQSATAGSLDTAVHLLMDAELISKALSVKAFTAVTIGAPSVAAALREAAAAAAAAAAAKATDGDNAATDGESGNVAGEKSSGTNLAFLPISCEISYQNGDRSALSLVSQQKTESKSNVDPSQPVADIVSLQRAISELLSMVERVSEFVEKQRSNPQLAASPESVAVGRYLMDVLAVVPHIDPKAFAESMNAHVHDILMVVYLAHVARAQLDIAQKLQRII